MRALFAVLLSAAGCGGAVGARVAPDAGHGLRNATCPEEDAGLDARPIGADADASHPLDATDLDAESGLSCSSDAGDASAAVTIATFAWMPNSLAVGAASVYWTIEGRAFMKTGPLPTGSVESAAADGCPATTLAGGQTPTAIALGASSVYWTADTTGSPAGGVLGVPYGGGAVATLATGQLGPMAITADATNVYWANFGSYEEAYNGSIASAPVSGGTVTTLAAKRNDPNSIAIDDSNVYWTDWGENAWSNGAILRVPKTGGAVATLASKRNDPTSIVVAAGTVYFIDTMGLESVPAAGGTVTTVLAGGALAYAIDGDSLYSVASSGAILSQPLAGGATTTLATTSSFAGPMAVGPSYLYWGEFSDTTGEGTIRRVAK
jgi:hypothetical protein